MSGPRGSKGKGMKFAEQLMQSQGWKEGQGLGKKENGISQAIKVKIKSGKAGVGHNSAEQFTFHWWDHIFNKTASSYDVQTDKDGVQMSRLAEKDLEITNKKPLKAHANRSMLYGHFIKSATLLSGGEEPAEKPLSSDSSEDEEEKLDLSSAKKMTDEELVRACGGRTAHKGARHGLTMSAKLARLEEQEREFIAKYGKKDHKCVPSETPSSKGSEEALFSESAKKRNKSKKSKTPMNAYPTDTFEDDTVPYVHSPKLKKKRKRKAKDSTSEVLEQTKPESGSLIEDPMEAESSGAELQVENPVESKKRKKKEIKEKHCRDSSEQHEEIREKNKWKKKKRKLQENLS